MKIKKIHLQNFKFHNNLEFDINKDNCLIYGENGSGKSSIYWGLYSVFKTYFRNNAFEFGKFKNNNNDDLNVSVNIDTFTLEIPNEEYLLPENISITNSKTIYFANQDLLDLIINGDSNFYSTISKNLKKYFTKLNNFNNKYDEINHSLETHNVEEKVREKIAVDEEYKKYLIELLKITTQILTINLKENYIVKLKFTEGILDTTTLKFTNPTIVLSIDDQNNLKLYFNEAKLKLTSIAIFFAMIKLEEKDTNNFKLLVLDDFLTSLDMANRKYILEYIFKEFEDYQKIILTHNLQFYSLIIDWLKIEKQEKKWDIKNIYTREIDSNHSESIVYKINSSYIDEAQKKLDNDELQICGNLIRKEFERIIHELEKNMQLGVKEETDIIVNLIINDKPIYKNQNEIFKTIKSTINYCKNINNDEEKLKQKLISLSDELEESTTNHNPHLKSILKNILFYRKIVLNQSSHDNPDAEIYRKEYKNSITIIRELNKLLQP